MRKASNETVCGCGLATLHGRPHVIRVPVVTEGERILLEGLRGFWQGLNMLTRQAQEEEG